VKYELLILKKVKMSAKIQPRSRFVLKTYVFFGISKNWRLTGKVPDQTLNNSYFFVVIILNAMN
jgi:hypothetical protein